MKQQGRLTITVQPCDRIPPVRGHGARMGEWVCISIVDTGSGIAADDLERIFEPFVTSKEVGHGTGLGLSQVFGFAKQSGGDVIATSEVGEGAKFTLFLPREVELSTSVDGSLPLDRSSFAPLRILVVEDNPEVGGFAMAALDDLGHHATLARNADEALKQLRENADQCDVVFSDVMMPGMNGIELSHEIRRHWPDMPIILTSGYSEILSKDGSGEFELLHKPYSIDALSAAFQRLAAVV